MSRTIVSGFIRSKAIKCSVVIVAAGSSERFGSEKTMAELLGRPVLYYSVAAFMSCPYVKEIIIVTAPDRVDEVSAMCRRYSLTRCVTKVVIGGKTRLESALSGISEVKNSSNLIAIHDGARPLVTQEVINSAIECAFSKHAAVAAIPSKDTVKIAPGNTVLTTPDRSEVFSVQTPQVFDYAIINGALTKALTSGLSVTDDASAVEALGFKVYVSPGSEENLKITSPLDMKLAETILLARKAGLEAAR